MSELARVFDVTLSSDKVVSFLDAFEATQSGGVLTIAGLDNGTLAIFAPGAWKAVFWRGAKVEEFNAKEGLAA